MIRHQNDLNVTLVEHNTAKSVVFGFFRSDHPRLTDKRLLSVKTNFVIQGSKRAITIGELVSFVRKEGLWGYCDSTKDATEIHYWIGAKATREKIIGLIAHELIHASGTSNETTASRCAKIASYAYTISVEDIFPKL